MSDSDCRDITNAVLVTLLDRRLVGVMYLLTSTEQSSRLCEAPLHALTHELKLDFDQVGSVYFTWAEEPTLNGHPIRLSVSKESSYATASDLAWVDATMHGCWTYALRQSVKGIRTFEEPSAYEEVVPPCVVMTGIEFAFGAQLVQITVIAPPDDLNTSLSDWRWSPSTVVTVSWGEPDLSRRPGIAVCLIDKPRRVTELRVST